MILDDEIEKTRDDWECYYNWKDEKLDSDNIIYKFFPNALEFMERNNKIVSYLDLKFDAFGDMPVKEIILGSDCKVDEYDIFHLLGFYGFDAEKVNIYRSQLSYRWR